MGKIFYSIADNYGKIFDLIVPRDSQILAPVIVKIFYRSRIYHDQFAPSSSHVFWPISDALGGVLGIYSAMLFSLQNQNHLVT